MTYAALLHFLAVGGIFAAFVATMTALVAAVVLVEPGALERYVHRCRYHGRHAAADGPAVIEAAPTLPELTAARTCP